MNIKREQTVTNEYSYLLSGTLASKIIDARRKLSLLRTTRSNHSVLYSPFVPKVMTESEQNRQVMLIQRFKIKWVRKGYAKTQLTN